MMYGDVDKLLHFLVSSYINIILAPTLLRAIITIIISDNSPHFGLFLNVPATTLVGNNKGTKTRVPLKLFNFFMQNMGGNAPH